MGDHPDGDVHPGAVVRDAPVGLLAVEEGTVTYANAAAHRLLDADEDIVGRRLAALAADAADPMARVREATPTRAVEIALTVGEGEPVRVAATARATDDDGERYVLAVRERGEPTTAGPLVEGDAALYEKLFTHSNDAIVLFDPERDAFVDCNPQACDLLGYDREELLSVPPTEIHPQEVDRFREFVAAVVDDGAGWTNQLHCYTKDGKVVPAEISATAVEHDGRTHVLASIRDLAKRQERERALADLHDVTQDLMEAEREEAIAARAVDAGRDIVGLPLAHVYLRDEDDRLTPAAASPELEELVGELPTFERGEGLLWDALEAGEPALYDDVQAAGPPESDVPFRSAVVVPLGDHGVFGFASTEPDEFDDFDVDLASILAAQTEGALDRATRERQLRERSAAMDAARDGVAILEEGRFVYANRAYATLHDYEDPAALEGRSLEAVYPDDQVQRFEWDVLPAVRSEGDWQGEAVGRRADGSTFPQALSLSRIEGGDDRLVAVVRDVTDRKQRLERMEALNEASRDLMGEETPEAVASAGVEMATSVFGFEHVGVWLYDDDADSLERTALSAAARAAVEERTAYDFEATLAGRAFRRSETVVDEAGDDPYADEQAGASLHVPLGEYGVVTVVRYDERRFAEETVRRMELLAGTLRSGLARAEREQSLRDARQRLEARRNELETLNDINGLLQDVIDELLAAGTPTAIERTVCERLAASQFVRTAWVGRRDGEEVVPAVGAGDDWDPAAEELTRHRVAAGLVAGAADSVTVEVSDTVRHGGDDGPTVVAAVPLVHGERLFGVLVVDATDPDAFGEAVEPGLSVFGETVGFAIQAARSHELLLSEDAVELEFEVEEAFGRASAAHDCSLVHESGAPLEGGGVRHYVRVEDGPVDAVAEHLRESDRIRDCEVLDHQSGGGRLEVLVETSPLEVLAEFGANLLSVRAEDGASTIVAEAVSSADVGALVDRVTSMHPAAELVAKREVDRRFRTRGEFSDALAEELTDRQQSVLEAAYEAGYYEWPREQTAEEVAEALDISSSTLHQHLRHAEAKLLQAFFAEET